MAIKKLREMEKQERNIKIGEMDLNELKKYLCMKNGQSPEKCDGCQSLSGCPAGQRAVVLLNERELEKAKERADIKRNANVSIHDRREIARAKFIQAVNQPNMIQFMMETYGNSRNCARENLKQWAKKYPDEAKKYDFEKKFAELTVRTVTSLVGSAAEKQKAAKERYAEAASKPDPIAFCMEKYGITRAKAVHNYGQWKRRYGELKQEEKTVNDEVSVEDFLKEVENTTQDTQESEGDVSAVEMENGSAVKEMGFFGEIKNKFDELSKEKEKLMDRISWIEKAQDALAMTLNVFNPDSAIGKALKSE